MADRHRSGNDLGLWIFLFITGAASYYRAYNQVVATREDARVTKEEKPPEIISQRTEDAISVRTLGDLANSPNHDIRQAAVRILAERLIRHGSYDELLRTVRSQQPETRDRAVATLRFLCMSPVRDTLCSPATHTALIDLLVSFLPASRLRQHVPDTDYLQRTAAERDAVWILSYTIRQRPLRVALDAGLVSRWLARYPFGGCDYTLAAPASGGAAGGASAERSGAVWARTREQVARNVRLRLRTEQTDDESLGRIMQWLDGDPEGRRELRKYELLFCGAQVEDDDWVDADLDRAVFGELQRRSREESEEEAALRRRRRQAMVIGEGGMPISSDNIYEV